jgi:hypothetical protein
MPEAAASPACEEGDLLARQELPASEPEAKRTEREPLQDRFACAGRIEEGKHDSSLTPKHSDLHPFIPYPGGNYSSLAAALRLGAQVSIYSHLLISVTC